MSRPEIQPNAVWVLTAAGEATVVQPRQGSVGKRYQRARYANEVSSPYR